MTVIGNVVFTNFENKTPGPNHYVWKGEQQLKTFTRAPAYTLKSRPLIDYHNKDVNSPQVDPALYSPNMKYLTNFEGPRSVSLSSKHSIRPNSNPAPNAYSINTSMTKRRAPSYSASRSFGQSYIPFNEYPGPSYYTPQRMKYNQHKTPQYSATFRRDEGWKVFKDIIKADQCQTGVETGPANYTLNCSQTQPKAPEISITNPIGDHLRWWFPKNNNPGPGAHDIPLDTVHRRDRVYQHDVVKSGVSLSSKFRRGAFIK